MDGILENNIIIGLDAKDRNDAIMQVIEKLEANGHIKKAYYDDVIAREEAYPTGLPTDGVSIAIPHASSEAIMDSTIGVAILNKPVQFKNMADDSEILDVEIIFLIANAEVSEQTKILQNLMVKFSEEEELIALRGAKSVEEVMTIIGR